MNVREIIESSPLTPLQLRVIALCFAINTLDGFDVMAIAYAAPAIAGAWQLRPDALGAVFSASAIGTALGALLLAPRSDVIGRRTMVLLSLAAIGATMIATGLARSAGQLLLIRGVNGLAIGSMLASLTSMGAEYTSDRHRNTALGVIHSGYLVGATVGGIVSAWLIPAHGWTSVFFAGGLLALVALPVAALYLPESLQFLAVRQPPGALGRVNAVLPELKTPLLETLPPLRPPAAKPAARVAALLAADYRNVTVRLWSAFFLVFVAMYFVQSWMPKIVVDRGLSLQTGIYAGVAVNLGGMLGSVLLGLGSRWLGLGRSIAIYLAAAGLAMLLFGATRAESAIVLALSFLIGFLTLGGFIGLYMAAARLYPTEIRTTGVGWAIGAGRVGAIASPYLAGVLIGSGWPLEVSFSLFAAPLLAAAVIAATILARGPNHTSRPTVEPGAL